MTVGRTLGKARGNRRMVASSSAAHGFHARADDNVNVALCAYNCILIAQFSSLFVFLSILYFLTLFAIQMPHGRGG